LTDTTGAHDNFQIHAARSDDHGRRYLRGERVAGLEKKAASEASLASFSAFVSCRNSARNSSTKPVDTATPS
jgi:hypothetical protein